MCKIKLANWQESYCSKWLTITIIIVSGNELTYSVMLNCTQLNYW